jgi:Ca2+-binding EF-hand superfamily protein
MSGISSVGSSSSTTYYSPLDTNQDGIVDASELEAAAQSGLLPASVSADEDDSDSSATDKFSDSLAGMLLQQMQQASTTAGTTGTDSSSSSSDDSSDQSSVESLFKNLDANGDGEVSSAEFVAGRPTDMSEADAQTLFKTLDTENTGMLNEGEFSQGIDALNGTTASAAVSGDQTTTASSDPLEAFLTEMQASMTAYQNTYGQYDLGTTATDSVAA